MALLVDPELQILGKLLAEPLETTRVVSQLLEHLKALPHQLLLANPQDLVLLHLLTPPDESLTRNPHRQLLRINSTLVKYTHSEMVISRVHGSR